MATARASAILFIAWALCETEVPGESPDLHMQNLSPTPDVLDQFVF